MTLLIGCGGGGGGGSGGATTPTEPLDIASLSYVRHSFVENTVKVRLPQWEALESIEFPDEFDRLELEVEPASVATGQWRSFFVVLEAATANQAFSNDIRNQSILSSRQLLVDGFPAEQTVYEGNITFTTEDGDGESLATPNQGRDVSDLFRFMQTTVDVNGEFYTLLYVAEVSDYLRYEEIAYHLAESMEFATRLPIQRTNSAGDLVSASHNSRTLFAYCEIDGSSGLSNMSLNSVLLTSGRVEHPEVEIASFPLGSDQCSATALAFGAGRYLVLYAARSGQSEVLAAQMLNGQGEAEDEGIVVASLDAVPSEGAFGDLKVIYDGSQFFAAWTELVPNSGSGTERRRLVGQFIGANYATSERIVFQEDLVPRYETEHRRLALASTEQSIGLVSSFASASSPSERETLLHLMDLDGNPLPSSPLSVRNHEGVELLDLDIATVDSTYSVFWVERTHAPEAQSLFDDRLLAHQFTAAGHSLYQHPVLVMGPLLTIQGLEREKNRLSVQPWEGEYYFVWESNLADDGNRYSSRAYGAMVDASLSSRSEAKVMEYVSSGLYNLTLVHHETRSYMAWLPEISANHAPVWEYSRETLMQASRVATETFIP